MTKDRERTTDNGETKKKTLSKKQRRRQRAKGEYTEQERKRQAGIKSERPKVGKKFRGEKLVQYREETERETRSGRDKGGTRAEKTAERITKSKIQRGLDRERHGVNREGETEGK